MKGFFPEPLQQVDRVFVLWRGRKLLYFAGCDYFRLSSHPAVLRAVRDGLKAYGLNVAASRRTTGNHLLYEKLELETAQMFGAAEAILTGSGYSSNLAAAQGLRGEIDIAFLDENAHASLKDAAETLGCKVIPFRHRDAADLRSKVSRVSQKRRTALLTDGVFAHNGSVAPLPQYRAALPGALLWVDDSHAAGILGKGGRGTIEHFAISRRGILQTITFSKAFGTYGGAILCAGHLAKNILNGTGALTGSTPLPLPIVNAALTALRLVRDDTALAKRLRKNIELFWRSVGKPSPPVLIPIISIVPSETLRLKRALLRRGIYPPLIVYPGGPPGGYFRFALSSEHAEEQIDQLGTVLREHV